MKGNPLGTRSRKSRAQRASILGLAGAIALVGAADTAAARTLKVTNLKPDGKGSLSDTIGRANRAKGPDRITFDRHLHGTIQVREALSLKGPVVVQGAGKRVKIYGGRRTSKLKILERGDGQRASLRDLDMKQIAVHARAHGDRSRIQIEDSTISGQSNIEDAGVSVGQYRGYDHGIVKVENSTVSGWDSGGVTTIWASAKVDRSTISDNGSSGVHARFYGHVEVTNSTITGNVMTGTEENTGGAGVSTYYSSSIDLTNSTVTGNREVGTAGFQGSGGGVKGEVVVNGSTITGNSSETGGGVHIYGEGSVTNSIIAGNTSTAGGAGDCDALFSRGGNLIQSPGDCQVKSTDLTGVDPKLGPLSDNGGPTETEALKPGSPAIGLAIAKTAPKFDQRGVKRGSKPDAGAYELGAG
jgi:hypothetical protein